MLDVEAVAADLYLGGVQHRGHFAEDGDLDVHIVEFFLAEGRETRILEGSGLRHFDHAVGDVFIGLDVADAAAQLALAVQADEDPPFFQELRLFRALRLVARPVSGYGLPRQLEQFLFEF